MSTVEVDSKSLSERKRDDEERRCWLESAKEMPGEEGYGESWTTVRKGKNVEKWRVLCLEKEESPSASPCKILSYLVLYSVYIIG